MSRRQRSPKLLPNEPEACPRCGGTRLEAVDDGELTNFFCRDCVACWHVELGYIHRVDATTCPGCEHIGTCLLAVRLERTREV